VRVLDGPHEITDSVDAIGNDVRHLKARDLNGDYYL
jgi:hypothetical protein